MTPPAGTTKDKQIAEIYLGAGSFAWTLEVNHKEHTLKIHDNTFEQEVNMLIESLEQFVVQFFWGGGNGDNLFECGYLYSWLN